MGKVPFVRLPCDVFILSLQERKEVYTLFLTKNSPNLSPDGTFGTESACAGMG
jgi:hypothetical protein